MSLLELFVSVDDFCQLLKAQFPCNPLPAGTKKTRNRSTTMTHAEIMTILVHFHQAGYRNFKAYYCLHVLVRLKHEFPHALSYHRFVELTKRYLMPLTAYLYSRLGSCKGISFVDSSAIKVCHNRRIEQHKTFAEEAQRGKTSVGWFFGFKLHLIFNDEGDIVWLYCSAGNKDDRAGLRMMLENPLKKLFGKLIGDRGYIGKAFFEELYQKFGVEMVTGMKKKMKNSLPQTSENAFFLRKRCIVETIIDQLKNISQIEHTRHRSLTNFFVNLICGLIAYSLQPKKPSLLLDKDSLVVA
jgi:hypothetical protein